MSTNFLYVSVKIRSEGKGRGFRVPVPPVALFVLRDAVISFDGYLGLIPGSVGARIRTGANALQAFLFALTQSTINVDVQTCDKGGDSVSVRVRTL